MELKPGRVICGKDYYKLYTGSNSQLCFKWSQRLYMSRQRYLLLQKNGSELTHTVTIKVNGKTLKHKAGNKPPFAHHSMAEILLLHTLSLNAVDVLTGIKVLTDIYVGFEIQQTTQRMYIFSYSLDEGFTMLLK